MDSSTSSKVQKLSPTQDVIDITQSSPIEVTRRTGTSNKNDDDDGIFKTPLRCLLDAAIPSQETSLSPTKSPSATQTIGDSPILLSKTQITPNLIVSSPQESQDFLQSPFMLKSSTSDELQLTQSTTIPITDTQTFSIRLSPLSADTQLPADTGIVFSPFRLAPSSSSSSSSAQSGSSPVIQNTPRLNGSPFQLDNEFRLSQLSSPNLYPFIKTTQGDQDTLVSPIPSSGTPANDDFPNGTQIV